MCVGIPLQLARVAGIMGQAVTGEAMDISLCPEARPGDFVLTHLGLAREVISADEARLIRAALDGLESVMAGGSVGAAFADLDARTPTLPPHLQAALDAGLAEG